MMRMLTRLKWRAREVRGAARSAWLRFSGYADRLEREHREWKAAAELRFRQYREARDLAYHLQYPPVDAGGALLLAADHITLDSPNSPCESAWQEGDTGACNCDRERNGEVCWCVVADELRQLEKALREGVPHNAQAIEARQGGDAEQAPSRSDESAVGDSRCAPNTNGEQGMNPTNSEPDFTKLRAERDAAIERMAREVHIKLGGDPNEPVTFHSCDLGGCYCACASGGPCEHEFDGWREFDDGCGGEQVCAKCGTGAMSHSMRFLP